MAWPPATTLVATLRALNSTSMVWAGPVSRGSIHHAPCPAIRPRLAKAGGELVTLGHGAEVAEQRHAQADTGHRPVDRGKDRLARAQQPAEAVLVVGLQPRCHGRGDTDLRVIGGDLTGNAGVARSRGETRTPAPASTRSGRLRVSVSTWPLCSVVISGGSWCLAEGRLVGDVQSVVSVRGGTGAAPFGLARGRRRHVRFIHPARGVAASAEYLEDGKSRPVIARRASETRRPQRRRRARSRRNRAPAPFG